MIKYLKMPPSLALFVWELNKSIAKFPAETLLPEPDLAFHPSIAAALQWMAPVKSEGVPQGAATSCSSSTIALRGIEDKYDVLIYADDIIYFPKTSDVDPAEDLGNYSKGLVVNEAKSR